MEPRRPPFAVIALAGLVLRGAPAGSQTVGRPRYIPSVPHAPDVRQDPHFVPSAPLQSCVDGAVHRLHLDARVHSGDLGLALADLTHTPDAPALAGVNTQRMLYAASVPKIATLAAAFQWRHDARAQRIALDPGNARDREVFGATTTDPTHAEFAPAFRETLRLSIYRSDNAAATHAVETVGFPFVASYVWDAGFYDPALGGGLWVGLGFGRGVHGWRPDPMRGLVHAATPLALVRFYTLLGQDRLVDAESSREIRGLMEPSAFYNRFRRAILQRYPTAHVYRKTGTMPPWRHDSALVDRPGARYAMAGMCRGDDCSQRLIEIGEALDDCAGR